jgi:hypothetical protein
MWTFPEQASRVLGDPGRMDLRQRVLNGTTFCAAVACALNLAVDLASGQPAGIWLVSLLAGLAYAGLHLLGRHGRLGGSQAVLVVLVGQVAVVAMWWVAGTLAGSAAVVVMALAVTVPMVAVGRVRRLLLVSLTLQAALLAVLEEILGLAPQVDARAVLQDALSTTLLLGAGLVALVALVVYSHQREREKVQAAGRRLERLNQDLAERNDELARALEEIRDLQRIIPVCAACHKLRNDRGVYEAATAYLARHAGVRVAHTLCPDCAQRLAPPGASPADA